MLRLGYACINTVLAKQKITTNRTMIKRTFQEKGVNYAAELALNNIKGLKKVVEYNHNNHIKVYRMSSQLFPWMSEYEVKDLHNISTIAEELESIGAYAKKVEQRLSFHPGPYNVLCSPNPNVVKKTVKELNQHAEIMDLMGLPRTHFYKINIHLGGAYGDREASMERFCKNFPLLSEGARARLTVENDDKASMYSTKMLYEGINKTIGVPIVFDSHHFTLGPQDQTYKEAFYTARSTWDKVNVRQICHHSNSRKKYDDPTAKPVAHSDLIHEPFIHFNESVDVVLEAKKKEQAIINYPKGVTNESYN